MKKEDLILVIDMQNVYLSGQKWVCLDTGGITCPVFEKSVYSSLKVPEVKRAALEATARGGRVVLTGVVAECCVLSTAFDAIDLGCEFIYVTDAVSGFDRPKEDASILMLSGLSPLHGRIMDTGSYLNENS